MTRQTVSICNVRGGVALSEEYGLQIAAMLEWAAQRYPDNAIYTRSPDRLRRIIRVLRGEAPADAGESA